MAERMNVENGVILKPNTTIVIEDQVPSEHEDEGKKRAKEMMDSMPERQAKIDHDHSGQIELERMLHMTPEDYAEFCELRDEQR